MSAQSNNGYMLIFRGTDWYQGLSPEQMQQVADQWMAWFNGLKDEGTAVAGNPLEREGKIVSGRNGRVVLVCPAVMMCQSWSLRQQEVSLAGSVSQRLRPVWKRLSTVSTVEAPKRLPQPCLVLSRSGFDSKSEAHVAR